MNKHSSAQGHTDILLSVGVVLVVILAIGITFFLRGQMIMERQLKEQLKSTAAIGATLFTGEELNDVTGPDDMDTPFYWSLVDRLQTIRSAQPSIEYAYIMRRTKDPLQLEFVADADSLNEIWEEDTNGDGILEGEEELSFPGDLYDISEAPVMQDAAFVAPSTDEEFTVDQWGTLISGYAPIFYSNGTVAGIVGIDMVADEFAHLSHRIISPEILILIIIIACMVTTYIYLLILRRKMIAYRDLDAERSGILALAMHQIGTPLTIFKWATEQISDCMHDNECTVENVQEHIAQLKTGTAQLEDVFTALVETSQIDSNAAHSKAEAVPLDGVLALVQVELAPHLAERRQELRITLKASPQVFMARKRLTGGLRELIGNASGFSLPDTTIDVRVTQRPKTVELQIIDQGCGIPAEDIPRIFQRFVRAANASALKPSGNGLGLYVAKEIIERLGGHISLESTLDKGTTVTITLPKAD